jgi:hypothetical protein
MLQAMHFVTCKHCDHTFETAARTNTRCRSCRRVVTISRFHSGPIPAHGPIARPSETEKPSELAYTPAGAIVLVGAFVIGGGFALYHGIGMKAPEGGDPHARRSERLMWIGGGAVSLLLGGALMVALISGGSSSV